LMNANWSLPILLPNFIDFGVVENNFSNLLIILSIAFLKSIRHIKQLVYKFDERN
jgi:hypothetical protein